jgi:flagellar motor switch protein FliM
MSERSGKSASVRSYRYDDEPEAARTLFAPLEAFNTRFARALAAELTRDLRYAVEIKPPKAIRSVVHREFARKLGALSHLAALGLRPLPGTMLFGVDAALANRLIERRFGGDGRYPLAGREFGFTPFERRFLDRLVDRIIDQLLLAWQPVARLEPLIARHDPTREIPAIAGPNERVLVSAFELRIGESGGGLTLCLPQAMLEPLRDRPAAQPEPEPAEPDRAWRDALARGVGRARLSLRVELVELPTTLGAVLELRPGSILDIDRPESVTVEANGTPLFRGRWGKHGGKIGVKIEERLAPRGSRAPALIRAKGERQ